MANGINRADAAAGLFFMLAGGVFGAQSLGLEIGTALRMGPGFFPLVLAIVLILLGLLILASAFRSVGEDIEATAWRGMMFILPAPIFFGLTVRGLGFVPSIFLTTLVAAMASFKMKVWPAILLAIGVTVFCTLVFSYALGLPFRRFGPWLSF
jgi:uncharacterized membrane protein